MRRRVNHIRRFRREKRVKEGSEDIKEEIASFFEILYKSENFDKPKLDGLSFPSIFVKMQDWLETEFEEEETVALKESGADKAPGPDGFNFSFIRARWGFLGMLSKFQQRGWLNREINATF